MVKPRTSNFSHSSFCIPTDVVNIGPHNKHNTCISNLIKPDNSQVLLFTRSSTANDASYTLTAVNVGVGNVSSIGTYKLKLYNYVATPTSGRPKVYNY